MGFPGKIAELGKSLSWGFALNTGKGEKQGKGKFS